jgi:hypothetical protein
MATSKWLSYYSKQDIEHAKILYTDWKSVLKKHYQYMQSQLKKKENGK